MKYHAAALRTVVDRTQAPNLKTLAQQPGVRVVHRLVVYYADGLARHIVATLISRTGSDDALLEVVHEGFFDNKARSHRISADHHAAFCAVLTRLNFDQLSDQPDTELERQTLWLLERASGSFYKSLLLSPHYIEPPYSGIVNAVDAYLPEAIREIRR